MLLLLALAPPVGLGEPRVEPGRIDDASDLPLPISASCWLSQSR